MDAETLKKVRDNIKLAQVKLEELQKDIADAKSAKFDTSLLEADYKGLYDRLTAMRRVYGV